MHFACIFETLCEDKFEKKMQKIAFLSAVFTLVSAWKTRGKTVLKLLHFACVLRHFVETSLKETCLKRRFSEKFSLR